MEGGTNPDGSGRTSPAGAQGAGQIMPGTGPEAAAAAGLKWDPARNMSDPAYSAALGRAYHAVQIARFGGDLNKADAAYNAGPGRVQRAVSAQGQRWLAALPAETQHYVRGAAPGMFGGGSAALPAAAPSGGAGVLFSQAPVSSAVRAATPQEVAAAGYPEGTAAQVDSDGKFVNLKTPTAGSAKPKADPVAQFGNASRGLRELDDTLAKIESFVGNEGGWATGAYGKAMQHVGGTAASTLQGLVKTASGQALNGALQQFMASNNGSMGGMRMGQKVEQAEGASLAGALEHTDQPASSYIESVRDARKRVQQHISDMEDNAVRQGVATRLPTGKLLLKGDAYKGHVYLGGDPAKPTSWKEQ